MKNFLSKFVNKVALILPLKAQKNLLVTGAHRTGTTLLGVLIAEADEFSFVYEPFNPDYGTNLTNFVCDDCGHRVDTWFVGANKKNQKNWYKHMKHLINSRAWRGKRSIIKDPFAYFSAEWLQKEFTSDVLVMIRNPKSFVSSLKKMDWPFDFNNLSKQGWLMDGYLSKYKDEITKFAKNQPDIIDQGILLWNIFYSYTYEMQKKHPEWMFIKLEDFNLNPDDYMSRICQKFDIKYTNTMKALVKEKTSAKNPVESKKEIVHSLNRNSKEQNDIWKKRLTHKETQRILEGTKEVRELFNYK